MSDEDLELVILDAKEKMEGALSASRREFSSVRTGRASSAIFERLTIEAYGVEMRLQEVASFSVPEARQLIVTPHDANNLQAIERAIINANMGLTPSNDGRIIRLNFPPLNTLRRRELVKVVRSMAEEGKQQVNGVRRQCRKDLDDLSNDGGVSEDAVRVAEGRIDTLKDEFIVRIESAQAQKEEELLEF